MQAPREPAPHEPKANQSEVVARFVDFYYGHVKRRYLLLVRLSFSLKPQSIPGDVLARIWPLERDSDGF
jgi:hypothetical protein